MTVKNVLSDLHDMALFVEVARALSFSAASRELGIPVATVSRRIAAFEEKLGVRLLNRSTRRVELTETGRRHFERCVLIAEDARLAHAELQADTEQPRGLVRLAMPVELGVQMIAPLLADFARQFPDISFDLDLSSRRLDRPVEQDDLVLQLGPIADGPLTAQQIGSIEMQLFAAPGYLQAHGRPAHPSELARHQCVTRQFGQRRTIWQLSRGPERVAVEVAHRFTVNSQSLIKTLIERGLGIGVMPSALHQEGVAAGQLDQVLPDWWMPSLPIHAVTTSRLQPLRVRLLLAYLTEHVR